MLQEQINTMHITCITLNYKLQSFETAILQSTAFYVITAKGGSTNMPHCSNEHEVCQLTKPPLASS
jgi:hypothetical protein